MLAEHDLRLQHFAVLMALADFGPLAQHELAERLGLNRSHRVGYLDEIQDRGLVGRRRDPADRRRQHVTLTEDGAALVAKLVPVVQRANEGLLAPLSADERRTLVELLRRVLDQPSAEISSPASRAGSVTTS
ncbi:MAG TPA: MarR family winged helix-turn-helix transcriptional regulator [Pseudonocardia sp.]|uniref:MarR family winged helix-turn-helix transcriptional regulator n=1 Tax=Pseudonocardia sp. TaxID=60912 RepID=UPI002B4B5CC7|nr:MarR family winged helix-turn-helix transcriptional regulator [Pseudonocardia sp.]HLU58331.1 MarR family winged helix-turn-helix transcriptional regulator [Pseudonocardia sp.]